MPSSMTTRWEPPTERIRPQCSAAEASSFTSEGQRVNLRNSDGGGHMKHSRSLLLASSLIVTFGTRVAAAGIPDASGVFHACYDLKTGATRIIDDSTTSCSPKEKATTWSMIGPIGPAGPQGV